jgi:antitoxin MazE
MKKQQRLQKWGTSFAVRIPKSMIDKLELETNDTVEIKDIKSSIVIKKADDIVTGKDIIDCFNRYPFKNEDGGEELDLSRDKSFGRDIEL